MVKNNFDIKCPAQPDGRKKKTLILGAQHNLMC